MGMRKMRDFLPISPFMLETLRNRPVVTIQITNRKSQSIDPCQFQWHWKAGWERSNFSGGSHTLVLFDIQRPNSPCTRRRGVFYGQPRYIPSGGPRNPKYFGIPYYAHKTWPRLTKIGMITHVLGGQPRPILSGGAPASQNFWALLHAFTLYEKQ